MTAQNEILVEALREYKHGTGSKVPGYFINRYATENEIEISSETRELFLSIIDSLFPLTPHQ